MKKESDNSMLKMQLLFNNRFQFNSKIIKAIQDADLSRMHLVNQIYSQYIPLFRDSRQITTLINP